MTHNESLVGKRLTGPGSNVLDLHSAIYHTITTCRHTEGRRSSYVGERSGVRLVRL